MGNFYFKRVFLIILSGYILFLPFPFILDAQSLQDQAIIQYYRSMLDDKQLPFQQKEAFYDSLIGYYREYQMPERESFYELEKMKSYYDSGLYLEAYKTGLNIITVMQDRADLSPDELMRENLAHLIIGKSCSNLGMFDESISHLFSITRQPDNSYTIEAYSYLGFVFMQMKQLDKSKHYNDLAMQFLCKADTLAAQKASCIVYNNLAGYYYNIEQLDSALYYLNLSIEYYDYAEDVASKSYIYHNMAIIYQQMGECTMAEHFFHKAIEMSANEPYKHARYLQNLAFLLLDSNKLDEAERYYFQALKVAGESDAKQIICAAQIELSDLYYKKSQYRKAWEYLKKGMELRDSIFSNQNMEKIALLSQQFDNYKISAEKDILEKKLQLAHLSNQKKNIVLGILVSLLLILSALAFFMIRRIIRNSAANIEKETKVTREEVRNELKTSLEEKNRKLAANALFLMRINEIFSGLDESIKQLSWVKDSEKRKKIVEEMAQAINTYQSTRGWDEFRLYFEQVHRSFYVHLNRANPGLSKMEQRLSALLVLNMSTKEIAQITHRSVRTIETVIYKLRKHLNIPPDIKTVNFLQTFLME
jgi:tetratricopeptide (TPR) repeat protein